MIEAEVFTTEGSQLTHLYKNMKNRELGGCFERNRKCLRVVLRQNPRTRNPYI